MGERLSGSRSANEKKGGGEEQSTTTPQEVGVWIPFPVSPSDQSTSNAIDELLLNALLSEKRDEND